MRFVYFVAVPTLCAAAAVSPAPARRRRVIPVRFGTTTTTPAPSTSSETSSTASSSTDTTTEPSTTSTTTTGSSTTTDSSASTTTTPIASTSSTTPIPTRSAGPSSETWTLAMVPKFSFGAPQRRGYVMGNAPAGTVAACPTDREYCIDTRFSDEGTCMFPSPEAVKECLDDTCAAHPGNEAIFKSKKEDSYCKDWQAAPEGRVCHWTTDVFCSCPNFSIVYTNAAYVPAGRLAPYGYAIAEQCKYPDNYKAKNKRELNQNDNGAGGPQVQPLQRLGPGGQRNPITEDSNSAQRVSEYLIAVLATCILVTII